MRFSLLTAVNNRTISTQIEKSKNTYSCLYNMLYLLFNGGSYAKLPPLFNDNCFKSLH